MATWGEFRAQQPQLAERVQQLFDVRRHKTMATVRADGSPRISGIECQFDGDDLTFGSMPVARKLDDLMRDPRCALHSPTIDPVEGQEAAWPGEAKISGRALSRGAIVGEGAPEGALFAVDVESVVHTSISADGTELVVEWWTQSTGLRRIARA